MLIPMKEQVAASNPPQTPKPHTLNRPVPIGHAQISHPALPVQRQLFHGPPGFTPANTPIDQNRPGALHHASSPAVTDQGSAQETSRTGRIQSQLKEGIEVVQRQLAETQKRITDDMLMTQRQTDQRLADYLNPIFNSISALDTMAKDNHEMLKEIIAKQHEHSTNLSDLNRLVTSECTEIVELQQFVGLRQADPQQAVGQQEMVYVDGDQSGPEEHGEGSSDISSDA